ncbi:MAG: 2-phospho-L-lactate guanylyltransferase [Gammaproteobacteria bacterium]|nr:2-phospho-L-lactate guanylyltransferase [Gammaproteobacteria bacterium]
MITAAVIPVRNFATAKQRLRPTLSDDECAALAAAMLADVMDAVDDATQVTRKLLLGRSDAARIAAHRQWEWLDDQGDRDLCVILDRAAASLAAADCERLLILPGDLPTATGPAISRLLAGAYRGLCVCPAARDGGTNALVVSPPDAIAFRYGADSARRHLEAGMAAGLRTRRIVVTEFGRDIDTDDDLRALCAGHIGGHTGDFLHTSGIAARTLQASARAAGQEQ